MHQLMMVYLPQEELKRVSNMSQNSRVGFSRPLKTVFLATLLLSSLYAESIDDVMDGFDDAPSTTVSPASSALDVADEIMDGFEDEPTIKENILLKEEVSNANKSLIQIPKKLVKTKSFNSSGVTGKLTEQVAFSYRDDKPHDNISSLKTSLLLDYEHKFDNGFKVKTNAKAYYDAIYGIKGKERYSQDERDELESEVELYDAYVEGSLSDNLDIKLGRQVVVWGRSDTIRVTDVLNPLDNRRPGMVDIEDLRLPVAMAKLDYFVGDWRVTPMAVLEQRFSKNPPFGSAFNPSPRTTPNNKHYNDITPALSVGGEFSGWDVNFYAAELHDDAGYAEAGIQKHDKVKMLGSAVNILSGSWLLKSELAYFDGVKYSSTQDKEFKRTEGLLGVEYNGIANTLISYDVALKKINAYDDRLKNEPMGLEKENYQHAFRVSSDFMNATIKANYLISLFGENADKGGFQRAWVKYDIADGIFANVGLVDYIGGSKRFDAVSNNDMAFMDITYSF